MDALRHFSIPLAGLKNEIHEFNFQIESDFFKNFEESPIEDGNFEVKLTLDKRSDMLILVFDFKGSFKTECDRCLADINLPMEGKVDLIVKYADQAGEDAEVIYITRDTFEFNVAKYIYEFIILKMPLTNVYDCESEQENVCDLEMLKYLEQKDAKDQSETPKNSPWEELKKFKKK